MADKVAERANKKIYGLVYSRASTGRGKPNEITGDDDLIIGSLPKEMMMKLVGGRSNSVRYRAKESLTENCIENFKGKESTEMITMKGKSKAECSKREESQTGGGVPIGNGQVEVDNTVQKEDNRNVVTPMKQKRGADGEIVRAYFSSSEKSLSRLRPRKEVPAFRMVNLEESDNELVVGKRVKVYWSGSRRWFIGRIVAFDNKNRLHRILYEDGDEEVLDLRKERFELEVIPTDCFKLKSEPHSAGKADGLDSGNVREAVMKQNSTDLTSAKSMTKSSESKQKKEAKKEGQRTSRKTYRKGTEATLEDLVSNVAVIPEKVDELVTNKASDMEKPGQASSEEDESNFISEVVKEATEEFEAETTVGKSHSEFWSMGSDNSRIKESGKAVEDDSLKISIAELAKKPKGSRKRLMPRAKRMRTNKALSREFGNVEEKLEADMKSHVQCDEVKTTEMDIDINIEAMEVNLQNISSETPGKKASEGDETSNEASFTTLDLTSKDKTAKGSGDASRNAANEVENLTKTENRTAEQAVIPGLLLNPHDVKDEREVLAAHQMELAASINKGEDELITGITSVQRFEHIDSMNTNRETESILEAESMKPCESSYCLQPVVSPEEPKPYVLQGKVKLENSESDKESKEGMDFISVKNESYSSKESQSNNGAAS
ncbi:hypothetical protein QUC31_019317 [Theobroma cacao]